MFHHILVPLDGSTRAERAIPVAARLARASRGTIVFVRVVPSPGSFEVFETEGDVGPGSDTLEGRLERANRYLTKITSVYASDLTGVTVERMAEAGSPSPSFLSTARLKHVDLIVMCSHGETGFKRWIYQSVTEQTIRRSPAPVLVLSEKKGEQFFPEDRSPLRVLVPLDGSKLAESALEPAARLIESLSPWTVGSLHLLTVIPPPFPSGRYRNVTSIDREIFEQKHEEVQTYLADLLKRLEAEPLSAFPLTITANIVISNDVPKTIIQQAETVTDSESHRGYDLITMATHGRSGMVRVFLGSVTEQILGATTCPLLVVRATKTGEISQDTSTETGSPQEISSS